MRLQVCFSLVVLLSAVYAVAQMPRPYSAELPQELGQISDLSEETAVFLTGKVQLEDGSPVPGSVLLQLDCSGQIHTEAYSDVNGGFSFRLNASGQSDQGIVPMPSDAMAPIPQRSWQACDLLAQAPGYRSDKISLSNLVGQTGQVLLGAIIMRPIATAPGFMISAADAHVPGNARKDFQKGQTEARKGKWAAARERFQKAIALYPRFATAWLALGSIQTQEGNFSGARQSFNQALQVDSRLVSAYVGISRIAATEGRWQELADSTSHLLEINPVSFPQFWFLNSVANFNLQHFAAAESSVLRSMSLDARRSIPKNDYLLGRILAVRHDYAGAIEHLKAYLATAASDPAAPDARKQLAEYERLLAPGTSPQMAREQSVGK
jgi:tetratricopeptide (TPR) repeat protein